jgi:hypothetical protein
MWQAQYQNIMGVLKAEDVQRLGDRQTIAVDT